jgi:hypothetical protein
MAGIPLIGAISSIASAGLGGLASYFAAQEQANAINHAADVSRQNFQDTTKLLQPSIDAGNEARSFQLGALGLPGGNSDAINAFRTSPGYDFALKSGKNAVQTSAAAGGQLFSGKTLKDLATYGQGVEDRTFGDWFDRLGGLSGAGSSATQGLVAAGDRNASTLAGLAVQGGDNRASSYISGANAITGGLQNLSDLYAYYNPVNQPLYGSKPLGQGGIGRA